MKKQITLKKMALLVAVLLWAIAGSLQAQTNLITNPGFDTNTSSFLVDGTTADQTPAVTNQLRRITSTTSATTETSFPTPASSASSSVSVTDGLWVKKQTFTASNMYCQLSNSSGGAGYNVAGANSTTNCLFMKIGGGNPTTGIDWTKFATQQKLALDNTKKYTFTFYAKAAGDVGTLTCVAYIADKNGNTVGSISGVPFYKTFTPTGSFVKYTANFDLAYAKAANSALDFSTAYVGIGWNPTYDTSSKTKNSYLYIDELSLSESTTPVISSTTSTITNQNPIPITITFNNPVTGFDITDLTVVNGAANNFTAVSSTVYTVDVTPTTAGVVSVDIAAAAAATDGLSNATLAATQFSRTYTAYYRSVTSGNWGTVSTWQSSVDNANWANATAVPTSSAASVTIQNTHEVTVAANATAPAIIVNGGGKLTVNDGFSLGAASIILKSDATYGTGTFVDKTSSGSGLTVSGTTTVQQYLTSGRNWYVSSPLSAATSNVFSATGTNPLYWYDETNGSSATLNWAKFTDNSSSLSVARGYIANMDATVLSGQSNLVSFTGGALNTGAITTGVNSVPGLTRTAGQTKEGFNLVGNPYPSYLDWMAAIDPANTGTTNLMTTMWYRTQNPGQPTGTPVVPPYYVFDTYNETASTGTNNNGNGAVTQYIPPMQAFWVRVKPDVNLISTTGTLALTNAMRSHDASGTNRLKVRSAKSSSQPVLRLQVSNGTNSDEAIVLFNSAASNGFDDFDSPKMSNGNNAIPEIYTVAGSEQVVINGLNSVTPNLELPLGFKTGTAGSFTIKATEISNFDGTTTIVLKDNANSLQPEQELVPGVGYTFASDVVNAATRFSVIFRTAGTATKLDNSTATANAFVYRNANNHIAVACQGAVAAGSTVEVYNLMGEKLVSKGITSSVTELSNTLVPGVYLVTVRTAGKTTTQRVILN